MTLVWILVFLASVVVLVLAADRFTESAERLGFALGIPSFLIGVTIVSIGTSLPELLTSLIAVFKSTAAVDTTALVVSNNLGSNIVNILLIVGLAAIVAKKLEVKRSLIELDIPLLLLSTGLLILVMLDGQITWIEGLILVVGYAVYLKYSLSEHDREKIETPEDVRSKPHFFRLLGRKQFDFHAKQVFGLMIFGILMYFGARYTVESVLELGTIFKISSALLGATAVAIGTSLPELVVSIQSARKGKFEIAIGNVFGSNIFNILLAVGGSALIKTLVVPQSMIVIGIPFLIVATLLYAFSGISGKIFNYEGAMYLLIYGLFIAKMFNLF
ncbi:calcium/sodium antiporter [Patescibacteria group bacterium]|nr:calcium/sodium antiporter [Patescibacteria group bacterium]